MVSSLASHCYILSPGSSVRRQFSTVSQHQYGSNQCHCLQNTVQNSNEQSENLCIALVKLSGMAVIELAIPVMNTHENSQQFPHLSTNLGQTSVVVFSIKCRIQENSQTACRQHWPSCQVWQSLNYVTNHSKHMKILNSLLASAPIWVKVVWLSSGCHG